MKKIIGLLMCICVLSVFFTSCVDDTNKIKETVATTEPTTAVNLNGTKWMAENPSLSGSDTSAFVFEGNKCLHYPGRGGMISKSTFTEYIVEPVSANQFNLMTTYSQEKPVAMITINGDTLTVTDYMHDWDKYGTYEKVGQLIDLPSIY